MPALGAHTNLRLALCANVWTGSTSTSTNHHCAPSYVAVTAEDPLPQCLTP
jgi:hypothetical protein